MRAHLMKRVAARVASGTVLLATACTFGGLANYDIEQCEPKATQADDVCNRLNADPATCSPYQCDPASHHCVQKTRDDDHDGDPPPTCGGTDCDDKDPKRSGKATEKCDGVDNNCNDLIDDDALTPQTERTIVSPRDLASAADPIVVPADDQNRNFLAAFLDNTQGCAPVASLEPGAGGALATGCALLASDPGLAPRQLYPLRATTDVAAAFIKTSLCATGTLAYRYEKSAAGAQTTKFAFDCDPAHPAALPSIAAMPTSANAQSGVLTWLEAPFTERTDPVGGCATAKPAKLYVLPIQNLKADTLALTLGDALAADELSQATRPVSLAPVENGPGASGMLVAAPLGSDVGVFFLTAESVASHKLPAPVHVSALAGARSATLATHVENGQVRIALIAEIGCHPQAAVKLSLGRIDPATHALTFDPPVDVVGPSDVATLPTVAWVSSRGGEWWTAFIDAKPHAIVRRFSAAGKPIGGPIDVGKPFRLGVVSSGESVFGLDPTANGGGLVEIPIGPIGCK